MHDGLVVLQSMLEDLKRGTTAEREDIHALYTSLYDAVRKRYEGTMRTIDGDFKTRNTKLSSQIKSVQLNLPLVQVHLMLSSIFAAKANKHEFLGLSQYLVDRLAMLAREVFPIK